ncbi:MAG: D-alanyl-D-alanine carboxypeptidase/D-alanyl-D-alanine-endopeptidase [Bacteroidetes bacterium]|nr:MAG: D-alanyl-D-alanine carboxypeptidase/D-alanyl-D-alanine-endopeptidase [Bacteroidota bacterium]
MWKEENRKYLLPAIGYLLFSIHGFSQNLLKSRILNLQQDTDLVHASWSICVLDIKKDSVVAEYNSNLSLIPASAHKIITTATALALLKWDFKYETRLEYDGKLDTVKGILHGNLYIKGSGDPTLASEAFKKKSDTAALTDQWAKILFAKGIKKIEGSVIGDATAFEDEMVPYSWIWGDMGNYYGAGSCGLNFKDNKFALYFKSGTQKGDSTSIKKIFPEIPGMKVINQTFTKGYSDNAYIYGTPYSLVRYVKGTIPANKNDYEVEGSQPDPPLLCAQSLDSSLRKIGVSIAKKSSTLRNFLPAAEEFSMTTGDTSTPSLPSPKGKEEHAKHSPFGGAGGGGRIILHTHTSRTLDKIVTETNMQSNNLFAETLLKTIAWKKTKFGEDLTGIDIVTNYWKSKCIDLKGFYMADGSGLSRFNAVNTKQLSEILRVIAQDSLLFKKFYESLPVAGKSGSLGRLCKGTLAENNLRAKSGYMTRVRSYAGYVASKKGNLLSFAIIVNNYDCTPAIMKDKLEKLMIAIAELE